MASPKKVVKEVVQRTSRGNDFSCSKLLKKLRFSMSKEIFRVMILNEKAFVMKKKSSGQSKVD